MSPSPRPLHSDSFRVESTVLNVRFAPVVAHHSPPVSISSFSRFISCQTRLCLTRRRHVCRPTPSESFIGVRVARWQQLLGGQSSCDTVGHGRCLHEALLSLPPFFSSLSHSELSKSHSRTAIPPSLSLLPSTRSRYITPPPNPTPLRKLVVRSCSLSQRSTDLSAPIMLFFLTQTRTDLPFFFSPPFPPIPLRFRLLAS